MGVFVDMLSSFNGLSQYSAGFATSEPVSDELFERYSYNMVGGQFEILTYRLYSGDVAVPDQGDTWILELNNSNLEVLARTMLVYDATSNCLLVNGISPLYCNFAIPEGEYGWKRYTIKIAWNMKCAWTNNYSVTAIEPTRSSSWDFRPTRFRPRFQTLLAPSTMRPFLPGDAYSSNRVLEPVQGDTSPIQAFVTDDLGCLKVLTEPEVTLEVRITPNTGGHSHFTSSTEPGTGKFVEDYGSAADPRATNSTSTKIKDTPDNYGRVRAYYKAGQYGTNETLIATASIPFVSPKDPGAEVKEEKSFDIKVPGLVEVATESSDHEFIYGGGCLHSPTARWMTQEMSAKINRLSNWYRTRYGAQISLNDASLKFGGFFDNKKGGGRGARCHGSHRQGIDIDINSSDRGSSDMNTTMDGGATRLDLVDQYAKLLVLERIPEKNSIHFRNLTHQ